jgi:murein DD-endopeptidase MepM/ murein hydrolase activator NlpD
VLLGSLTILAIVLVFMAAKALRSSRVTIVQAGSAAVPVTAKQPPEPTVELSATSIPQGGTFSVRLKSGDIDAAIATFRSRDYPMIGGDQFWYALIGLGQRVGSEDMLPAGDYPVSIRYQFTKSRIVASTQAMITVTPTNFPVDAIDVGADQVGLLAPELEVSEGAQLAQAYSAFTPQQIWQGPFAVPVQGTVTTAFGARRSYQGGPVTGSHAGVDIGVPLGTPITASAAGRVAWTGQLPDRGNGVIIDHGLGVFTGYFHMSRILAQMGQMVQQGDTIGLAGSTGLSTGPHVHWEIVIGGTNVDGLQFLRETLP